MSFDPTSALVLGGMQAYGQGQANQSNEALARTQMRWQEYMSNTAHQRSVADMRKAGINPMLAYMKGSGAGASTPSGATARHENVLGDALTTISTAMQVKKTIAEIKGIQENARLVGSKADLLKPVSALTGSVGSIVEGALNKIGYKRGDGNSFENMGSTVRKFIKDLVPTVDHSAVQGSRTNMPGFPDIGKLFESKKLKNPKGRNKVRYRK